MLKTNFLILLFIHILCDFYLQTNKMAEKKKENVNILLLHCFIYAIVSFTAIIILFKNSLAVALFIIISHLVTDVIKFMIIKSKICISEKVIYISDQLIHIACLLAGAYMLRLEEIIISGGIYLGDNFYLFIKILVLIPLLSKPANITVKRLTEEYRPVENSAGSKKSAGAFIGTMERYIILLLLYLGQYSAIGLVLTAKSIARYHEMENREFAEYYLIGTLLSTLMVILAYLLILM